MDNPSSSQRFLANLIVAATVGDGQDSKLNFTPSSAVTYMHKAPRFGHSNRVGILASSDPDTAMDYAQGLKQFTLFVLVPFVLWGLILLAFKFLYGSKKVGCAAGGQIIDIRSLSKQGVARKTRKQYIIRNWRLQATYQIVAIVIPTLTILLMKGGWTHMNTAFQEVQETLNDVSSWSHRGQRIVRGLQRTKNDLEKNVFVQQAVWIADVNSNRTVFDDWCPHQKNSSLAFLQDSFRVVQDFSLAILEDDYARYVPSDTTGFQSIQDGTTHLENSLDWLMDNQWTFKLVLMILNVINLLLLMVCYIFSKNNIIHPPTRAFTTWLLLPTFLGLTLIFMGITAVAGVATLFNADFCSGGPDGSPQGTFHDAILSLDHGSLDYSRDIDGAMGLVYDSFVYYSNGCLTDHPLAFLQEFGKRIDTGVVSMTQLSGAFEDAQNETFLMDTLSNECGADVSFLPETLGSLQDHLQTLQEQIHAFVDLTSCSEVSPIIRRVTHGAICDESAKGFTWIWASCFSLLVCCFTLLTVRAALFNSIKKGKSREKKPKRVVEKEFEEYKEYMTEYYGDEVGKWQLEGAKKKNTVDKVEFDLGSQFLHRNPTFGTESSSPESAEGGVFKFSDEASEESESKSDAKEQAAVNDDSSSVGSSYDSCSDDSQSDDSADDQSAFVSFMIETKSMVRQSLESAKELGSTIGDNISIIGGSVVGGSVMSGRDDDHSVISSFSSKASSLARQAIGNVRKLKPLLGVGHNVEDSASIDDESLFLAPSTDNKNDPKQSCSPETGVESPENLELTLKRAFREASNQLSPGGGRHSLSSMTAGSAAQENLEFSLNRAYYETSNRRSTHSTHNGADLSSRHSLSSNTTQNSSSARRGINGIWRLITPTSDEAAGGYKKLAKTPMAPKKTIRFLSRTTDFSHDEMQPLTPNRPPTSAFSLNSNVQPVKLRLSPYLTSSQRSDQKDFTQRRQGRPSRNRRIRLSLDDEAERRGRDDPSASPPRSHRFFKDRRSVS